MFVNKSVSDPLGLSPNKDPAFYKSTDTDPAKKSTEKYKWII